MRLNIDIVSAANGLIVNFETGDMDVMPSRSTFIFENYNGNGSVLSSETPTRVCFKIGDVIRSLLREESK